MNGIQHGSFLVPISTQGTAHYKTALPHLHTLAYTWVTAQQGATCSSVAVTTQTHAPT